jgi:hypothetical protein
MIVLFTFVNRLSLECGGHRALQRRALQHRCSDGDSLGSAATEQRYEDALASFAAR